MGDSPGAPTGPVIIPGSVLGLAGIGVRVAYIPVMLLKCWRAVDPDVVGGVVPPVPAGVVVVASTGLEFPEPF